MLVLIICNYTHISLTKEETRKGLGVTEPQPRSHPVRTIELHLVITMLQYDDASPKSQTLSKTESLYIYEPLDTSTGDQIRLLDLHSGNPTDPIVCDILHANLADKPRYESISYTWSDSYNDTTFRKKIKVNNDKILYATSNCEAALRRVRHPSLKRRIWIDSLCINQLDICERNHQVSRMKDIYSCATSVLIYAGEACSSSDLFLEYLITAQRSIYSRRGIDSPKLRLPEDRKKLLHQAAKEFLSRKWFQRVWVVQEVALARRVTMMAGDKSVDWGNFSTRRFKELGLPFYANDGTIPAVLRWEKGKKGESWLEALHICRSAQATDPRDKLYALAGLFESGTVFSPDYRRPWEAVFTGFAIGFIVGVKDLRMLQHVRGTRSATLPSWVPDWTVRSRLEPLPASHHVPFDFTAADKTDSMLPFDALYRIGYARTPHEVSSVVNFMEIIVGGSSAGVKNGYPENVQNQYLQLRARRLDTVLTPASCQQKPHFDTLAHSFSHHTDDFQKFREVLYKYGGGRRLFETESTVGLGPEEADEGDEVWELHGAAVPFVLRPDEDEEGVYKVVGECYLGVWDEGCKWDVRVITLR